MQSSASSLVKFQLIIVTLALAFALSTHPAHAIPSPELIVGSITGLSQLGAIVAALFGGGTIAALGRRGTAARAMPLWLKMAIAATIAALAAGNIYQWSAETAERDRRLAETLSRPTRLAGQPQLDATLKELSFAEQSRHALGLSTADAEIFIANAEAHGGHVLDIRESAEVEMGTFELAHAIRYPDLMAGRLDLAGKRALLICHNGNRSAEVCIALAERGIDCRFIVGGLEKWITEGRQVGGFSRRSLKEVRAVPAYPGQDRLLETSGVHRLVGEAGAIFVDVRYPGEHAAGHLPGAINLPMRRMTSEDLARAIAGLPDRPVIVPCYERRSCFFGELLGLELTRRGRDFRGRYTLPWEYFVANPPPPHVAAFLAAESKSTWQLAAEWLAREIELWAGAYSFVPVILLLALLSRLIVLPLSLKADRDQIVARQLEPEIAAMKQKLAADPLRSARALREIYRTHGLTPLRNQLALALLPLLALNMAAIDLAAARSSARLPWISSISQPDPWGVLPVTFGVLLGIYLEWSMVATRRARLVTWGLAVPLFVYAGMVMSAAGALYLVASAALLLLQRAFATGAFMRLPKRLRGDTSRVRVVADGILPLVSTAARPEVGNKAHRLGRLLEAGAAVPDGVVLTHEALQRWVQATAAEQLQIAHAIARAVAAPRFAVRSSAAAEDASGASFAGVFESRLDVTRETLPLAIDAVLASFAHARTTSYGAGGNANILVQRMIVPQFAGVLFTRAPDAAGLALIELVSGTAERLVSGAETPQQFRFGRLSGLHIGDGVAPIELAPLLELGLWIEALFGAPQDIEWTYADGRFHIVQSRDITAVNASNDAALEPEWCRLLTLAARGGSGDPREPAFVATELTEMLPRPTPMSLSLLEALHAPGGSADLACRALGLTYAATENASPLLVTVFGRLYVQAREARGRAPQVTALAASRIKRAAPGIARHLREDVIPRLSREHAIASAIDLGKVETTTLLDMARGQAERFTTQTHVEAEIVNIVAELLMRDAEELLSRSAQDAATWLVPSEISAVEATIAQAQDLSAPDKEQQLARSIGHRAALDYELASPRYREVGLPAHLLSHVRPTTADAPELSQLPKRTQKAVTLARAFMTLKEDAKHAVLMELCELRRLMLEIGYRLGIGQLIFELTIEEALAADTADSAGIADIAKECSERAERRARFGSAPRFGASLSLADLELTSWAGRVAQGAPSGALLGRRVAGSKVAAGRAYVVDASSAEIGAPLADFCDGDILVTPMVHPTWLSEVLRSGGVVAETGGFLSHMAIVARERDIAMIVGVSGLAAIEHGADLRLEMDGTLTADAVPCEPGLLAAE